MAQITFLTLLLGLVSGVQPVEVAVSGPVAKVELRLDDAAVATLTAAPWKQRVDFGADLLPHELEARALAADGSELGSARQWINLPRPPAELTVALEGAAGASPSAARISWRSLVATTPGKVSLSLDGLPLAVDRQQRAALPRLNLDVPHLLSAAISFGAGVEARQDMVLGQGGEVMTSLTAVPVRVRGSELPPLDRLSGWFTAGGETLHPVAIDAEPRQVVVVRDPATRSYFFNLAGPALRGSIKVAGASLAPGDRVRLLSASALRRVSEGVPADLFSPSRDFTATDGGLDRLLNRIGFAAEASPGQRLADAVAVAGLQAAAGNLPRAVVLVLAPAPNDASRFKPAAVRRYLAALRVPLHVWYVGQVVTPGVSAWGEIEDISSRPKLIDAIARLRADVESQRIVFVEGLHRPQTVRLAPEAAGVEPVGGGDPLRAAATP